MSGDFAGEQLPNVNERHPGAIDGIAIDDSRGAYATQFWLRRVAARDWSRLLGIAIIILFWTVQFTAYTVYQLMNGPDLAPRLLVPRAANSVAGILVSIAILAAQKGLRRRRLPVRAYSAVGLAIVGAALQSVMAEMAYLIFVPDLWGTSPYWVMFASDSINRLWGLMAISAIILAITYSADIREREERIDALQALAHSAQIRALRNQLNPHFLFNALNSIAGLISAKRVSEAETMTENLADFLRLTLAQDPQKPITLDEELQLQGLYLDIEQVRFPGRLDVKVSVPPDVRNALVPSLITQPLIENSIKHAVARSTRPVELRIDARAIGDQLELVVSDSGGDADANPSKHSQLGLSNVAERLRAHYGEEGRFVAESDPAGGFRNVITIPFKSLI